MAIMQTVVLINFMGVTMKTVKGIIDPKVLWMSLMDGLLDPLACSALCIRRPAFLPSFLAAIQNQKVSRPKPTYWAKGVVVRWCYFPCPPQGSLEVNSVILTLMSVARQHAKPASAALHFKPVDGRILIGRLKLEYLSSNREDMILVEELR